MTTPRTATPRTPTPRRARRRLTAAALAAAFLVPSAYAIAPAAASVPQSSAQHHSHTQDQKRARGALLGVERLAHKSRAQIDALLAKAKVKAPAARYGGTLYRLTYATITPQGAPTTASALLVLPDGGGKKIATVSETHGTTGYRGYAPSGEDSLSGLGALLYAAGGRAVVAPDYLGLGSGPGRHPYMDTRSSVSASLDALRAGRTAAGQHGKRLTGEVYVTGFSQGGQVAVALAREIQRGAAPGLRLRALAPVSGPYAIGGEELPGMYDGRVAGTSAVFYLSYFLTAQNRLHPLYSDPRQVFRAPYSARVEGLFDGSHKDEEISAQLPRTIEKLLTPKWYADLRHPTGALARVVRLNDGMCAWGPRVPVRLHTSHGDRDVPRGNTVRCAKDMAAHGVKATVVDHGEADHGGTYREAVGENARWFARLDD
ncbi:lipase family protein [Streptomyces sp. ODS28]|uniref:lipase family protein n=1 Tax=Streptomyces sp. ODS28 TaxID=3136688 RepID=UPI0031F09786